MTKKEEKPIERNYSKSLTNALYGKSAGHCTLCNRPVCYDTYSHTNINTAEVAHIRAFSDLGPRADKKLPSKERNKIENLILLCGECHSTIDKKIAENIYTVEWLKTEKEKKEKAILEILTCLTPKESYCIKFVSAIDNNKFDFENNVLLRECFKNGIHANETVINLSTNNYAENSTNTINQLNQSIKDNLDIIVKNNSNKEFCIFALAPQYLLINLGYKLSDKLNYNIFTKQRNGWVLNKKVNKLNKFKLKKPIINKNNKVAIIISSTAIINRERVLKSIGEDVDIWEIKAEEIGTDKINTLEELTCFQQICSQTIDEIGAIYGKEKTINLFSAMCNSLALKFGQSIFHKSHNKILIYDTVKNKKGTIVEKPILKI